MIKRLKVKGYLLFDDISLDFVEGFNVLTGETGAGKSLIVGAIELLLGGKVDWSNVRRRAYLEMVIENYPTLRRRLRDLGIPHESEVVVRRTLNPESKRSRIFINDMQVSARTVASLIGEDFFVGHQFASGGIGDPTFQTEVLDRFANVDLEEYPALYLEYRALERKITKLRGELDDLLAQEDYLRFQLEEIERLNLKPDEEDELLKRREEIEEALKGVEWGVRFQDVYPQIRQGISILVRGAPKGVRTKLAEVLEILDDISLEVTLESYSELKEELDRINARLYEISRIKGRFKTDLRGLWQRATEIKARLERLRLLKTKIEGYERDLVSLRTKLEEICKRINKRRREALNGFGLYVKENLEALGFDYVDVEVLLKRSDFYERGNTQVSVLLRTVPDLPFHGVSSLSGGELSRAALVFFSTGASRYRTLILDEIDAGVSPTIADRIGRLLALLSSHTQIIGITHQAFTAHYAHRHFAVRRLSPSLTTVEELKDDERWRELARMLGLSDVRMVQRMLAGDPPIHVYNRENGRTQ
ncbi:MAG: AAA family ATPase [Thermotogae bacterium]|nr:AAA family ATPase [Thermotogota bacterium]